jgi:hypothetical protein
MGGIGALGPFSLEFAYRKDLLDSENQEKILRLLYTHQCFQLALSTLVEPEERSYHFTVILTGLGN